MRLPVLFIGCGEILAASLTTGSEANVGQESQVSKRNSGRRGSGVAAAVKGLLLAVVGTGIHAQDATLPADPVLLEDIVVTGTRIARSGYDQPTPVTVIGEADIQQAGTPNLSDFVNELPSVAGSSQPATGNRSLSGGTAGINSVNLRSLGNSRTLVLLDGHRSVGSLAMGTVDVNNFPQGLVKNIEIVTGGASAAYGSDAVSGVVNFVLDRTYTGIKASLETGQTSYGDDQSRLATLTAGSSFAGGRGHALFSGEVSSRDGIYGMGGRDWADDGWHMVNNPAYAVGNGAPEYLVAKNSGQSVMTPGGIVTNTALRGTYFGVNGVVNQFAYGATRDPWTIGGDWALGLSNQRTSLEPENRRHSLFTRFSYQLFDNFTPYVEASLGRSRALQWGGVQSDKGSIVIQADNAFIPASVRAQLAEFGIARFNLGSSNADIPTRESDNDRETRRVVVGFDGSFGLLGSSWKYDGYYQGGVTDAEESLYAAYNPRLQLAQDAVFHPVTGEVVCRSSIANPGNGCVPFNRMGIGVNEPGAYDYFMGRPYREQRFQQNVFAVNATTSFTNPWLEPIGFAIGAEYRTEEISGVVDPQYSSGWIVGNFLPTFGKYNVKEAYLETLVPLPGRVEFNGAIRGTQYSTSGTVVTWKTGLSWSPIEDVKLRATLSRDIRAPNMQELFEAGRRNTNFVTDPFNNNVSTRYTQDATGNPLLEPEKADTVGLGIVYRPSFAPGFGLSVDYYDIEINGAISSVTPQEIVDRCFEGLQQFCDRFFRIAESDTGQDLYINNSPFNFIGQQTRGLDLEVSYSFGLESLFETLRGTVAVRALATNYLEMSADNGIDPPTERAGTNTSEGPPDWLYRLTASYALDGLALSLTGRGISAGAYDNSYVECQTDCPLSSSLNRTIFSNHIAGAFYVDAFVGYTLPMGNADTQVFFKISNLADKDPVVVGLGPGDSSNVEPGINRGFYDYAGRTFRLGVRVSFGG
jgi:outer membrane receptor protein involved in Fe transport